MGGWGWPNDYVCLHSGWVGVAKCLRNLKELKNGYPENTELIKAPYFGFFLSFWRGNWWGYVIHTIQVKVGLLQTEGAGNNFQFFNFPFILTKNWLWNITKKNQII